MTEVEKQLVRSERSILTNVYIQHGDTTRQVPTTRLYRAGKRQIFYIYLHTLTTIDDGGRKTCIFSCVYIGVPLVVSRLINVVFIPCRSDNCCVGFRVCPNIPYTEPDKLNGT